MLFFRMTDIRQKCFIDTLENATTSVEVALNQIDRLHRYENIDKKTIEQDLAKTSYDLEINLSILAITLRKMSENGYIHLSSYMRTDLNSLIHCYRFNYDGKIMKAYSQKGEEVISIDPIIEFARNIIKQNEA